MGNKTNNFGGIFKFKLLTVIWTLSIWGIKQILSSHMWIRIDEVLITPQIASDIELVGV